jgi:hypothetical protein
MFGITGVLAGEGIGWCMVELNIMRGVAGTSFEMTTFLISGCIVPLAQLSFSTRQISNVIYPDCLHTSSNGRKMKLVGNRPPNLE